jgi:hypothetical protein
VRLRQRVTCQKPQHHIPRYPSPLRAATQPLAPHRNDSVAEVAQRLKVSGNTEIRKVSQQLPSQCCRLLRNRFVPISLTPVCDALESAPETVHRGLLLHDPKSLARHGPVVSEAQQVEGVGPGAHVVIVKQRRNPPVRLSEVDQPGLLRVKRQTILRQPLRQHVEHSPRASRSCSTMSTRRVARGNPTPRRSQNRT